MTWSYLFLCLNILIVSYQCSAQDTEKKSTDFKPRRTPPKDIRVNSKWKRDLLGVNLGNTLQDKNDLISLQVRQKNAQSSSESTEEDTAYSQLKTKYDSPREESWGKKQQEEYYKVAGGRTGSANQKDLQRRLALLKALKRKNDENIERLKLAKSQREYDLGENKGGVALRWNLPKRD